MLMVYRENYLFSGGFGGDWEEVVVVKAASVSSVKLYM